jgi:signal transduction histidine kinase
MKDNHPQLPAMVDRISETLIQQIETLSSIASAFSDFAKMPKAQNRSIDLAAVLSNIVNLYSENEHITVSFEPVNRPLIVYGDKDQLIRIFSNLMKNAIQSIPGDRTGYIKVTVEVFIDHYVIAIEDNGEGIPEDQKSNIFVPNFTTKTTGTGLGLAMAKDLVEGMKGEIWFESSSEGTTFFVRLPSFAAHT